ncbi:MAG: SOS response-associated peptidase, partial [Thermodesulfovibrionales bacterium]
MKVKVIEMCGRFVRNSSIPEIAKEFDADEPPFEMETSYNVAPTQNIVIVINDGENKLVQCKWGFIPSWAKDDKMAHKMINARGETVSDKPAFRSAFKKQRCLVVADGFYEWKKEGKSRIPVYIRLRSRKPFGLAGLYSVWHSPEGKDICTSTIITTDSNKLVAPVHNRMPVIIREEARDLWLDPEDSEKGKLLPLL